MHFQDTPEFQTYQNIIKNLQEYRQRLNICIVDFQQNEWGKILEILEIISDIEKKLADIIKHNNYRKDDYQELLKKERQTIKSKVHTYSPPEYHQYSQTHKKSFLQKLLPFFGK